MTDKVSAAERSRIGTEPRTGGFARGRRIGAIGLVAATTVATLVAGTVAAGATPIAAGGGASAAPTRLGAAPQAPLDAVRTGTPADSTRVQLSVGLEPRDVNALKQFVTATSTPGNAQYHHFLAKGQFAGTFGPTQSDIAKVTAALKAQGLQVGKVSADGMSIAVSGTLATAGHAFGTGFSTYKLADGTTGFLNTAAPQVPGNLAGVVSGVTGLSTLGRHTSYHTARPGAVPQAGPATVGGKASKLAGSAAAAAAGPEICATATNSLKNLVSGRTLTDGHGFVSAGNLARAYGMEHTATSGSGVTIGVFEMENFSDSDLAGYQACYGTNVNVTRVKVDGGPTEPVYPTPINGKPSENGIESLLDLEDISALAPGANVIDYQGPDLDNYTDQQWWDTYQRMVTDDTASVLSISYGECEADLEAWDRNLITAEGYSSMEAAAQGQTILVSSGDDGASGCHRDTGSPNINAAAVADPASQPYVTAVGGTSLTGNPVTSRTTWTGSGGGTSNIPMPNLVNYQNGFAGKGFTTTACKPASGYTCRQVPDVSANADPQTGYPVYIGGAWTIYGGTSAASPTWAAMLAIANTQPACQANGRLGQVNNALYAVAKTSAASYAANFTDITTGVNRIGTGLPGFSATASYDLATGLGEPKAGALSTTLCGSLPLAGAGTFHPVPPTLLLDTRKASSAPLPASGRASVQITGAKLSDGSTIPTTGVTSVVLNVTVTGTTASGYLTASGDRSSASTTSTLNWTKGKTIANLVTIKVPGDGKINFYVSSPAHVLATVQGYFTKGSGGQTYNPIAPIRVVNTLGGAAPTNTVLPLSIRGPQSSGIVNNTVPADATAVVVNYTVTGTGTSGWLGAGPSPAQPTTSNLNWGLANSTLANLAITPIGTDGKINIRVSGSTQVIADVFGYYSPSGGFSFTPTAPTTLLDTRPAADNARFGNGETRLIQIGGQVGVPNGVKAVVLNVTSVGSTHAGWLRAWASDGPVPAASNLNWSAGAAVPNQVVVPVGADGKINIYTNYSTDLIIGVFGYYI